jgi:succinyl-CoA synthetase beta subunit
MDVHEYQAKELLANFGVTIPRGAVAFSPDQAVYAATELGGWHWAVKAQIHAGGRGKAGGVKICTTYHEVHEAARALLGKRLVTADRPRRKTRSAHLCRGARSVCEGVLRRVGIMMISHDPVGSPLDENSS